MKLEKAIEIIKDIDVLDDTELKEAYETVLQELEHLQKEKAELMNEYHKRVQERIDIEQELKDSISKDKIREKIEEVKNEPNNPNQKVIATQIDASLIAMLHDLLKEE